MLVQLLVVSRYLDIKIYGVYSAIEIDVSARKLMMTKAFTMRLPEEKAAELEAVARADGVPVSEAVRDAIDEHIDARRKDKDFQARLSKLVEDNQRVLDRLAQ